MSSFEDSPLVSTVSPKNAYNSIGVSGKSSRDARSPTEPSSPAPNTTALADVREPSESTRLSWVSVLTVERVVMSLHDIELETRVLSSLIHPVLVQSSPFLTLPSKSTERS